MKKNILTKNEILKKLENNKNKIKSFGVKKLWLFGSYARGDQKEDSDIDFLVEFEDFIEKKYNSNRKLGIYLEDLFNKNIDAGFREDIEDEFKKYILTQPMEEINV